MEDRIRTQLFRLKDMQMNTEQGPWNSLLPWEELGH